MKAFVKQKNQLIGTARFIFLHISSFLAGLLMARGGIFGTYLPFGPAVVAALPREYCLTAAAGGIIGSFIPINGGIPIRYICAILMAAAARWLFANMHKFTETPGFSAGIAFVSSLSTALFLILLNPSQFPSLIHYFTESLIAGGSAYFICIAIPLLSRPKRLLSPEELTASVISLSVALIGISPLTIYDISPARIASVILILAAACYGKETAGAICGIAAGFAMSAAGENLFFIIGAYALGGLMAGIFSRFGKLGSAATFILGNLVILAGFYKDHSITPILFEILAGGLLFLTFPKKLGNLLSDFFSPAPQLPRVDGLRRSLVMRLKFASSALDDVSSTVEEVTGRLKQINAPELTDVFVRVEDESCSKCGLRIYCFETSKKETLDAFMKMTSTIRSKGYIAEADYPESWKGRCCHAEQTANALAKHYNDHLSKEAAERRISEVQSVISDQFCGLSDMLYDMADEFEDAERYDTDTAVRMDSVLRKMGIISTDISCRIDKWRRMTVEISARPIQELRLNKLDLTHALGVAANRRFSPPCITNLVNRSLITLTEKAHYRVEVGVTQHACRGSSLCGDAYSYFDDGKGRTILMISDGMGNGGRAAVDGSMASGLMTRMLKAGFGFESSLKMVNSAMLFKSTDESLATLDTACIDLFSGSADFYKAGAAESIVRKNGKIGKAVCKTYPAGILRDVTFDRTNTDLTIGDIIVMFSDGVVTEDNEWVENEILNWDNGTAQELSEHLAALAKRRRTDHEDDITVMVGIVQKEL